MCGARHFNRLINKVEDADQCTTARVAAWLMLLEKSVLREGQSWEATNSITELESND